METLIELYDERAIENILGPDMFRPRQLVFLCPQEVAQSRERKDSITRFLRHRGLEAPIDFIECSFYKSDRILAQLRRIYKEYGECVLDVTGGTDAALFAAGMFCKETKTPAFTFSRKRNRFYDISGAGFADNLPCDLVYKVEEFFQMAGGTMRKGRVDNAILCKYMDKYDAFFALFLQYRKKWVDFITFMTRISQNFGPAEEPLLVEGHYYQKGERGSRIPADPDLLWGLEEIGFIYNLEIDPGERVSFTFSDYQIRAWLRDVGSVLELYMYKACVDADIFNDVISSAIVDWDGTVSHESVSNEIDVVASRGIVPIFISCKATEVKTEALNELAILKERFGGKNAKAAIVTTEHCNAAARHRAAQLGIAVIDLEELSAGLAPERIKVIMKVKEAI